MIVDDKYYCEVLLKKQMLAVMRRIASNRFVFQQDSAPMHSSRETVQLPLKETLHFLSPDQWPPNSPDLNPTDYKIWRLIQERVYKTLLCDTNDLKQRLIDTWASIPRNVINEAVGQWRQRLCACVKAKGHHFEHQPN